MSIKKKNRPGLVSKLKNSFRLAVFNDTTHEEIFKIRSNGLLGLMLLGLSVVFIIICVIILISFTALRELIPGYPGAKERNEIVQNAIKLDSLERTIKLWDYQLSNIQRAIKGQKTINLSAVSNNGTLSPKRDSLSEEDFSMEDSILRVEVMRDEKSIQRTNRSMGEYAIESLNFFPPVKGIISGKFNPATAHPYIDISAQENSSVYAVLAGTVILASWTEDSGYTIQIQHDNNLISAYKHNARLLKKAGDKVLAGSVIALVGNTGKITTGSHLHFELWYKGQPIDPTQFIKF